MSLRLPLSKAAIVIAVIACATLLALVSQAADVPNTIVTENKSIKTVRRAPAQRKLINKNAPKPSGRRVKTHTTPTAKSTHVPTRIQKRSFGEPSYYASPMSYHDGEPPLFFPGNNFIHDGM